MTTTPDPLPEDIDALKRRWSQRAHAVQIETELAAARTRLSGD